MIHVSSDVQRILGEHIPLKNRTERWNGELARAIVEYIRMIIAGEDSLHIETAVSIDEVGLDIIGGLEEATALRCLIPGDPIAGPYPATLEELADEIVGFLAKLNIGQDVLLDQVLLAILLEKDRRREKGTR